MKNLFLIVLILFSFLACKKNNDEKMQIAGKWIETTQGKDTIVFGDFDPSNDFTLYRERILSNGYLLPKSGSGIYDYTIAKDSIALRFGLLSFYQYKNYFFKLDSQKNLIQIGNFFDDSLSSRVILTFSKMK